MTQAQEKAQETDMDANPEDAPEIAGQTEDAAQEEAASEPVDIPITQDDVRLIEAMLFASPAPLTVGQMAERFPADRVAIIPDILEIIREQYAARGVNLVQREKRYALRTATDLADSLRLEKEQPKKFTRAAMETMAIVAYHQPVTRAEIENIRGVATSAGSLDALMEAGWIKTGKRREVPGRPVTWLTTQGFLDHFGLESINELPGLDELKASGLLDKRPAIEAMPTSGDLFEEQEQARADEETDMTPEITDEDLVGKAEDETGDEAENENTEIVDALDAEDEALEDAEAENADEDDVDDEDEDEDDDDEDDADEDDVDDEDDEDDADEDDFDDEDEDEEDDAA